MRITVLSSFLVGTASLVTFLCALFDLTPQPRDAYITVFFVFTAIVCLTTYFVGGAAKKTRKDRSNGMPTTCLKCIQLVVISCLTCFAFAGCGCFQQAMRGEAAPPPALPLVESERLTEAESQRLPEIVSQRPQGAVVVPPSYAPESSEPPAPEAVPTHHVRSPAKPLLGRPVSKSSGAERYQDYMVKLGADKILTIPGTPGEITVWIGLPEYEPNFPERMAKAYGTLPALGVSAQITPDAPAFEVEPKESGCVKIDPTGYQVGFKLTPTRGGTFDVGANVSLYDSNDCSGAPTPKGTTYLKVQVKVRTIPDLDSLKTSIRKMLLKFWFEILALFCAVVLFLIRKQLKKWIGF